MPLATSIADLVKTESELNRSGLDSPNAKADNWQSEKPRR